MILSVAIHLEYLSLEADMKGSLLAKIHAAGKKTGNGGSLQYSPAVTYDAVSGAQASKNVPVDTSHVYEIVLPVFL